MAIPWLLAGLAVALVVSVWDEIVNWLKQLFVNVKQYFRNILHATAAFAKRVRDSWAQMMHRVYYRENRQWIEETTTREIKESEVPERIRRKIRAQECEVTDDLEALGLEV